MLTNVQQVLTLTITSKSVPVSGPAGGAVELAGVTCQADRSDVVNASVRFVQFQEDHLEAPFDVFRMVNDLGHRTLHLIYIIAILCPPSKGDYQITGIISGFKKKFLLLNQSLDAPYSLVLSKQF